MAIHSLCRMEIKPKKTKIATWPPVILANRRTHKAKGLTNKPINSTGIKMMSSTGGTPEGIRLLK